MNYNGIYPAHYKAKLGLCGPTFMLRNLSALRAHDSASPVSLIDFVVIKRYPMFMFHVKEDGDENVKNNRPRHVFTGEAIWHD